jgi:hypothetical protein
MMAGKKGVCMLFFSNDAATSQGRRQVAVANLSIANGSAVKACSAEVRIARRTARGRGALPLLPALAGGFTGGVFSSHGRSDEHASAS